MNPTPVRGTVTLLVVIETNIIFKGLSIEASCKYLSVKCADVWYFKACFLLPRSKPLSNSESLCGGMLHWTLDLGQSVCGFQSYWPWQMWAPWFCSSCLLQTLEVFTSQAIGLQSKDVFPRTGKAGRPGFSAALLAGCWAAHQKPAWLLLEAGQNGIRCIFFAKSAHSDNVNCFSD